MSKLSILIHLSWTFQWNEGFSRADLPSLYLCGSLRFAVEASHGPTFVCFSTIINSVTA